MLKSPQENTRGRAKAKVMVPLLRLPRREIRVKGRKYRIQPKRPRRGTLNPCLMLPPPQENTSEGTIAKALETPAAEVPAAEVPAAKVSAAKVPAAEVPAAEVPAEEVSAEEVPAEEVPAEENPAEEVPAEEV